MGTSVIAVVYSLGDGFFPCALHAENGGEICGSVERAATDAAIGLGGVAGTIWHTVIAYYSPQGTRGNAGVEGDYHAGNLESIHCV